MYSVLFGAVVFACVGLFAGPGAAELRAGSDSPAESMPADGLTPAEREWLAAHPVIRYAPDLSYAPIEAMDGTRHWGIAADYLQLLEAKLGIRFELHTVGAWDQVMAAVQRGDVDVVGSCNITPERREWMRFTRPYLQLRNAIIVRKDGPADMTLQDLAGKRVHVVTGHAVLDYLASQLPGLSIETVPDYHTALRGVAFGTVDAMVGDIAAASYGIQHEGITNLRIAGYVDYDYHLAFATRKDWPELAVILDKGLALITEDERQAIWDKWVRLEHSSRLVSRELWTAAGAILLGSLILVGGVSVWNRSLKREVRARTAALDNELAERKRTEEALRQSERSYRQIFNATREAILIHDAASSAVLDVNERMLEMFGYTREEAVGLTIDRISADPQHKHPEDWIGLQQELRHGPVTIECQIRRKTGELLWVEVSLGTTQIGGEGRILAVVRDISGRKQAEAERHRLEQELRQAQKMQAVGTLATGIAHDFNNLLTIIKGFTSLAQTHLASGHPAQEPLEMVETAVSDASGITRSLLTLGRKSTAVRAPVDLNTVVRDSLRLVRRALPASIDVDEQLPVDRPVYVNADVGQLHQMLLNLITNARDAMPDGGRIRLGVSMEAGHDGGPRRHEALLVVEDSGEGMSEEVLAQAFDPFFTTKPRGRGTGLGLTMVHAIVGEHEGQILLDSRPGSGTRVTVRLPVCEPGQEGAAPPERHASPTGVDGGQVLLAEDSPQVRAVIVRALEQAGFGVVGVERGDEAASMIESMGESFDLVVLDVDLPGADGRDVARQLHAVRPQCPVVIITGNPDVHLAEHEYLRLLRKPFTMPEIVDLVRQMLVRT